MTRHAAEKASGARQRLLLAGGFVIALTLWMLSGLLSSDEASGEQAESVSEHHPMAVEIRAVALSAMNREVVVNGQLDAHRHLDVRAETSGIVAGVDAIRGQRVAAGEVLAHLDAGEREANLREAKARVKTARSERDAAADLNRRGMQSQVQLEQSNAGLESALAQLDRIERDIVNTRINAPFSGVINASPLEVGALVERGDIVAQLIDNSRYKVRGQVSQQDVARLRLDQKVEVELITGRRLEGTLSWISAVAANDSRSFAVEAVVELPLATSKNDKNDGANQIDQPEILPTGISATMRIPVENVEAAFITPSVLVLGNDGELGVMVVDSDNVARFVSVEMISTSLDGAWVSGIRAGSRLITMGQGFINPGDVVEPQFAP